MQTIINRVLIVIGVIYVIVCFVIPQETLDKYEWYGLVFFIAPYMSLVIWALLKTEQAKDKQDMGE